jgi:hypothetical protein
MGDFTDGGTDMTVTEKEITVHLSLIPYHRLQELAQRAGKTPETLTREILERALEERTPTTEATPPSARQILEAAGRVRLLSRTLQQKIIPGVTLEEIRSALQQAEGPSLSDIILRQREPSR